MNGELKKFKLILVTLGILLCLTPPVLAQENVNLPKKAREKGESGKLTAAELNAVKGLLEPTKGKGEPTETEKPIQREDVYFKKVPLSIFYQQTSA